MADFFSVDVDGIVISSDVPSEHFESGESAANAIALLLHEGFAPDELTITAEQNTLTVEGHKTVKEEKQMLYQGISARSFRRVFSLADHVQVQGAAIDNGLLKIELVREVPEAMKPRKIAIGRAGSNDNKQIEQKKAA